MKRRKKQINIATIIILWIAILIGLISIKQYVILGIFIGITILLLAAGIIIYKTKRNKKQRTNLNINTESTYESKKHT